MKVGRRLAIKMLNASKFALEPPRAAGPDHRAGGSRDDAQPSHARERVDRRLSRSYDYARALQRTETFFWRFCDDYLELVKGATLRRAGRGGGGSANAALTAALSVLLRLFAPFLPFVTEEVWSWWQEGSIHTAAWPMVGRARLASRRRRDGDAVGSSDATNGRPSAVRSAEAAVRSKQPLKVPITRVTVKIDDSKARWMPMVEADLRSALRVLAFDTRRRTSRDPRRRLRTGCRRLLRAEQQVQESRESSPLLTPLLIHPDYRDIVRRALDEDVGSGDITTGATVRADQRARGVFLVKADCVLAGMDVAIEVFRQLDPDVQVDVAEQTAIGARQARSIAGSWGRRPRCSSASARRSISCSVSRASRRSPRLRRGGRRHASPSSTRARRRRRCGPREYAVRAGGATNHRIGLFDAVLIKDNHVRLAGGVAPRGAADARRRAR